MLHLIACVGFDFCIRLSQWVPIVDVELIEGDRTASIVFGLKELEGHLCLCSTDKLRWCRPTWCLCSLDVGYLGEIAPSVSVLDSDLEAKCEAFLKDRNVFLHYKAPRRQHLCLLLTNCHEEVTLRIIHPKLNVIDFTAAIVR